MRIQPPARSDDFLAEDVSQDFRPQRAPRSHVKGANAAEVRLPHRVVFTVMAAIVTMTAVRLMVAAAVPLAADEALYWRYSKHLAAGWIDHPFLNPLMISIGTHFLGDTPLGVRALSVLLSLPASWAIWRATLALFRDPRLALNAALLFNLTVVVTVGSIAATSDQVVVVTTCFTIYGLARLNETGRGAWWIAVGVALGLGMCAKYTTAFLAVSVLGWLCVIPGPRRWLLTPWPWLAGVVALAIFSPVILWNAEHRWASLYYQSGRLAVHGWSWRYAPELLASIIGFLTPPIFVLACIGLYRLLSRASAFRAEGVLLAATVAPILGYFFVHSLHERVQGNWPEPAYPALAIAAAFAAHSLRAESGFLASVARWSRLLVIPVSVSLAGAVYLEAAVGILPETGRSPRARLLSVGWRSIGEALAHIQARTGARAILTPDYELNSLVLFYLPSHGLVEQLDERMRWTNEPPPASAALQGPVLFICQDACPDLMLLARQYRRNTLSAVLSRRSHGREVGLYQVYLLDGQTGPVLASSSDIQQAN